MENQRIRISKRMLKEALLALLREKEFESLTVHEICKRADINRATFYKYYKNQRDLLEEIENDFLDELFQRMETAGDSLAAVMKTVLDYFAEDIDRCRTLLNCGDENFTYRLLYAKPVLGRMEQYLPRDYPPNQMEYIYTFIYSGDCALLRKWVNAENRESPDEMVDMILRFTSNLVGVKVR